MACEFGVGTGIQRLAIGVTGTEDWIMRSYESWVLGLDGVLGGINTGYLVYGGIGTWTVSLPVVWEHIIGRFCGAAVLYYLYNLGTRQRKRLAQKWRT